MWEKGARNVEEAPMATARARSSSKGELTASGPRRAAETMLPARLAGTREVRKSRKGLEDRGSGRRRGPEGAQNGVTTPVATSTRADSRPTRSCLSLLLVRGHRETASTARKTAGLRGVKLSA